MKTIFGRLAGIALAAGLTLAGSMEANAAYNRYQPEMSSNRAAAARYHYRKSMRHYRHNPGARQEIRTSRRIYCRQFPSRC